MKPVHTARLSLLAVVLGAVLVRPALAAGRSCAPLLVDADAEVIRRWPELPEQIRATFAERDGVDACARVKLGMYHSALTLEVRLADGRSASRSLTQGDDVVPLLEALLLVPRQEPAATAPEPPATAAAANASRERAPSAAATPPRTKAGPHAAVTFHHATQTRAAAAARDWGIELSVVAGARIGDGQASLGLGALSLLDLWGWLVGFQGRADSYGDTSGTSQAALELGVLAGRRFERQNLALDLIVGPAVAFPGSFETVPNGLAGEYREVRSAVLPRLHAASHLHFGAHSKLRVFIGIDAEVGPRAREADADLPPPGKPPPVALGPAPLPLWMLGLALGATVGTR